jgi:hypothetical protein
MTGLLTRRRIRKRAGVSAAREYERLKKEWRARNRTLFRGLALVVAVALVATWWPARHDVWLYLGGMLSGALLMGFALLRESPPPWIENYQVGAWGEERTAKVLAPLLRQGWVVRHDLNRLKSNLDHVVIGPGGVFILDTKNLHGSVHVNGDVLSLTRPGENRPTYAHDKAAHAARRQGVDLNRLLKQRCGIGPWVTAVVVVWADFPQRSVDGRNMSYVHGDELVEWLSAQPARLNAKQVEQIAVALEPGQRRRPRHTTDVPAQP